MLDALVKSSSGPGEEFDLLIVGGGATGAGVAVDAATRGLKVALVERDDFSSGAWWRRSPLCLQSNVFAPGRDRHFIEVDKTRSWRCTVPPKSRVRTRL